MIDLCTLGCGGSIPMPNRALASLYVRVQGRGLVIDCGEGTQVQIEKLGWGFGNIDTLLLTHFHADHCSGLPGLLLQLAKAHRAEPLHIYGPAGLENVVRCLRVIAPQLTYEICCHELPAQQSAFHACGMEVTAFPLNHGMPCLGYSFCLPRSPEFQREKAEALAVPVRLWRYLQAGQEVETDGRVIRPEQVLGPARQGICFLYATDTRPVPAISELGQGADLMILEGMYPERQHMEKALKNRHMLYEESAQLAKAAGAKALLLTHFSTRVEEPEAFLPMARSVFPNCDCAADGLTLTLRFPEEAQK